MKVFKVILFNIIFIISLFLLEELFARGYFYLKHKIGFKESFLYEGDEICGYKINSKYKGKHGKYYLGIRKDYFEIAKGNKTRIVCLGGSTTFGHGQLDNSKVWPQILERLLNSEGEKNYEVLNAGIPGYGSSNILARLKKDILILKPDIIIIFSGWNLAGCLKSKYNWVPDNVYFKKHPILQRLNSLLVNNSVLYAKMNNLIKNKINKNGEEKINALYRDYYKEDLPIFKDDLEKILMICKENDMVPVLIKYPTADYHLKRYIETIKIIEDVSKKNNVYLIDCASYFKSLDDKERTEYFTDIAHFSDKGNDKMAHIIYSALMDKGLVR